MSDEEIVEVARKFIEKNEITKRSELKDIDQGLYQILRERKLLDEVGFEAKKRQKRIWIDMTDEEVVEFAQKFIEENEITGRGELENADRGLYKVLMKRGLLDCTFARMEQQRDNSARDAVIDALTKFANSEKEVEVA
ncbi:hypothetical protein KKE38_03730 [Candidatus Micrarchaeota archaeon]|nr:hypothetical protein [Candidatus Micrarchaeota archaeon]